MSSSSTFSNPAPNRNVAIAGGVVALHVAALWALQSGLLQRAVEVIVPVAILSELIEPPKPRITPQPPPAPPTPVKRAISKAPPPPQPLAIADPTPSPNAPTGVTAPQPPAPPIAAPVAVAPAAPPAAPPAPPRVDMPSTDADYLQNPKPSYPPMSRRLGEQGKVIVRVFIGIDGLPQKAEIKKSSGYERLDQSASEYVMRCRYVPGKVAGVPQPMWYDAPVNFVLN